MYVLCGKSMTPAVTEAGVLCTEVRRWLEMEENGRIKYTRRSGKTAGAETNAPAATLSHNTRTRPRGRPD